MRPAEYILWDNKPQVVLDHDSPTASHILNCVAAMIDLAKESSAKKGVSLKVCELKDDIPVLSAISIDHREGVFTQLLSSLDQPQRLHFLHYDEDKSTGIYFAFPCVFIVTESMIYKYHVGYFHRILDRCEK